MEYILLCLKRKSRQLKRRPSAKENVLYETFEDEALLVTSLRTHMKAGFHLPVNVDEAVQPSFRHHS